MRPTLLAIGLFVVCCAMIACAKSTGSKSTGSGGNNNNGGGPPQDTIITTPVDPAVSPTVGFFLNGWQGKTFSAPATTPGSVATDQATDHLTVDLSKVITKVPQYVYGNNSNLWMGQIVTQPALMQYIKDLSPNIIRAPAGSVSDVYFFNQASAAPADAPANLYNSSGQLAAAGYWFGGNPASWTLDIDDYYSLQASTNSTGVITINYGYARYGTSTDPVAAAAHLAADWVRYDHGRSKFWEIGNETYGNWEAGYQIDVTQNHDGQPSIVTGDLYGQHVKVFADSMRAAAQQTGATIYIGASLVDGAPYNGAYPTLQTWNQGVLSETGSTVDFYMVHDYFTPYNANSTAAQILATGDAVPASAMNYLTQQMSANGVSAKPIAMTEWNIQAVGSKQGVSFIAGMHAVKALGSLIRNHFGEASRWDLANGYAGGDDMGMFNVGDETGVPLWNPRPAFYYMYYFQKFFGDRMVADSLGGGNGDLSTYSSSFSSGQAGTIIVNSGTSAHSVAIDFKDFAAGKHYYWYVLTGGTDNGEFSGKVYVNGNQPTNATGGPTNYGTLQAYAAPLTGTIKIDIPARAVIFLVADGK